MANLTLSLDDKLLQAARVRAVKEGTSVNEICRKAIEAYARPSTRDRVQRYLGLVAEMDANRPAGGSRPAPWKSRDEMYQQVLEQRHPTILGKKKAGTR